MSLLQRVESEFENHIKIASASTSLSGDILQAARLCSQALKNNNKVIFCGNGGSASDSQHLCAELIGRLKKNRVPLAAVSLTADTAALTCIGNDFGYEQVFSRQLEGIGKEGDILISISTSGQSANIINALETAEKLKIKSIAFLGKGGGSALKICTQSILVPSNNTGNIQEMHILIGHIVCGLIENLLDLE
ncbi:MAG: phosphoheptose isomerase [Betaproteobacteria bacterium TMED82]|nr:MAG: phosphoheptose isomerase [Betaproteobacteria bacterium TMED82]|tara:strand:+ start:3201 stop:3776 length:576 start_codon:yes stop_codon:yes gene_type:complete